MKYFHDLMLSAFAIIATAFILGWYLLAFLVMMIVFLAICVFKKTRDLSIFGAFAVICLLTFAFAPVPVFAQSVSPVKVAPPGIWTDLGTGPLNLQVLNGGASVGSVATCPTTNVGIAGQVELDSHVIDTKIPFNTAWHVCAQGIARNAVLVASPLYEGQQAFSSTQTPLAPSSGVVANATASVSLTAVANVKNYLTGFTVQGLGATAAACVNVTITGLISGTLTYPYCVPAGVTTAATPLNVTFPTPLPATAANVAITVSVPAVGAGNTETIVNAFGYRQ